jgi:outer membrane protein assembly factor BamB
VGDRHRPRTGPDRPGVDGRPGRRRRGWLLAAVCLAVVAGLVVLGLADGRLARRAAHKVGRVVFHVADRSAPTGTVPARVRPVALTPTADWAMYHGDVARSGVARGGPALRRPQLGWVSAALDQPVYGQPLVVGGRVLVATQGDSVYALDERSGALLWRTKLGEPVAGGSLPCGNIDPVGVTSTPVADPAAGLMYVVGFLDPDHPHHELVALDLGSGAVRFRRPADPPGTDPRVHNQRGALVLANGRVYVAFGGRYGDCGRYHGWVVGLPASGDGSVVSFRVPTAREAGIWAPAGPVVDRRGELLVATGNGASSTRYDEGSSVLRLAADLRQLDAFAPPDWAELSRADADLGSVSPTLVGHGLVFQVGKAGVGYLLAAAHLGGVGGERFSGQVCQAAFGATASRPPWVYVSCLDGLVALRVATGRAPAFRVAWRSARFNAGPPIVAGGAVWTLDQDSGVLFAFDPATGRERGRARVGLAAHFAAPSAAGGLVLVATGRQVTAITMG